MTDIEDLWNAMPAGRPPTAKIVQLARTRSRRRRLIRRPLLAAGACATAAALFAVALPPVPPEAQNGAPSSGPAALSPVAFRADLSPVSCDALLATYVDRALGLVTAWGWETLLHEQLSGLDPFAAESAASRPYAEVVPSGRALDRVTASETGTNVQEARVDEPDTVKTNGQHLIRLRNDDLLTYDITGPTPALLSTLRLPGVADGELILAGDTVVVVGGDSRSPRSSQTRLRRGTRVQTVSLTDPGAPQLTTDVTYEAALTSARQNGDTISLVLSTGLPEMAFIEPGEDVSTKVALAHNRRIVQRSSLATWLPGYDVGAGRQDLLECRNVAVPPERVGLDTVAVVTFSPESTTTPQAFGLAGATTIAYESSDHLYLASTPTATSWWRCLRCRPRSSGGGGGGGTSYLFRFDLVNGQAIHTASGEVEGAIRDRWSMDEVGGQLRVLVGPSSETGDFNSVVTFRRAGDRLIEQGRLDRIGPREDIKSVRWQDDLALVVTFRRIDPLYVIDLSDDDPQIVSELKIPGYSSYLHPLGRARLIGVGQGRGPKGWGAQMGLFSVRDLARVRQIDVTHYKPRSEPVAATDPRSFTWLPEHRTVLTVIRRGDTGWLSIQRLADSRLHNRMIEVEYGEDIAQVRTLGMPDGRVVLVTGEDVRFLELKHPADSTDAEGPEG